MKKNNIFKEEPKFKIILGNDPDVKKLIQNTIKLQQETLDRKNVDWNKLKDTIITI